VENMKRSYIAGILVSFFLISCSGENPQIVLSSPEAFAFTLDEGWELNATVIAAGFQQNEDDNDNFNASLSYSIDMVTPEDSLVRVDFDEMNESQEEEPFTDIMIESQIELNSNFPVGDYKIIFYVTDQLSQTKDTATVKFTLTNE
jgi:hypothetical protein